MNNKEINTLRKKIARKAVIKIVIYSLIVMMLFYLCVDVFFNDALADFLSRYYNDLYHILMVNKQIFLLIVYVIIFAIVSFLVIKKSNNYILEVLASVNKIIKSPDEEIMLSSELVEIENRLNKIRLDLISSQNVAKEENQKKNDLIMYMAHDLKTPLTSVIGYLSLLNDEKNISKDLQQKYLKIALNKAMRLEELTNQFFEITRYNLKDMLITKNRMDLSLLLEQLLDESYPMLQKRNLKFKITKPNNLMFMGDGDKLARALGNLIKNAINYSYENTEIEIEMKEQLGKISIVFRNKGDKIPKYKLEKIFEKFYRGDESRTSETGGTGLGLAIAKEIIELHDGSISVKNDDEFIEFYVELHDNLI